MKLQCRLRVYLGHLLRSYFEVKKPRLSLPHPWSCSDCPIHWGCMSSYQRTRCCFHVREVAGLLPGNIPALARKFTYGDHSPPDCDCRLPSMSHTWCLGPLGSKCLSYWSCSFDQECFRHTQYPRNSGRSAPGYCRVVVHSHLVGSLGRSSCGYWLFAARC